MNRRMPVPASTWMIGQALKNFRRMPKPQRIDLMVEANVMTAEQAERAKKRWAELQHQEDRTP